MPPQHGKSRLCSVEFPAWLIGNRPETKVVTASYGKDLAIRNARQTLARVQSDVYQAAFGAVAIKGRAPSHHWQTVRGGFYKAVGVGSALTGHGADLMIIDDPVKDHKEALSESMRENVWQWFVSTAFSRLSPGGAIVLIMTRWHMDDLAGRLLDKDRQATLAEAGGGDEVWTHVNLPALAKPGDPIGRAPGTALFHERYNLGRLMSIRSVVGSYFWSALYMGEPVPLSGGIIRPGWLRRVRYAELPEGLLWCRFWDLAAVNEEDSDYFAGARCALGPDGTFYIADIERFRADWPAGRRRIEVLAKQEKGCLIGVEAVGPFKAAYANLVETMPPWVNIHPVDVDKNKVARALAWAAMAENGQVCVVDGPWLGEFETEVARFPLGAHDDQVDAVSGAYAMLAGAAQIRLA